MKKFAVLMSILFAMTSFASTGESKSFVFDGHQRSNSITVQGTKTHTEYRYEQVPSTCYRTVIVGHQTTCRTVQTGTRCTTRNGQRYCEPVYTRQCTQTPVYRQVPYTCYQTVRVPYEVFDYYTQAQVNFNFASVPVGISANERMNVSINGDDVVTTVNSSGKLIMLYNREDQTYMQDNTKYIVTNYMIEFIDLARAVAPIRGGIRLVETSKDELVFQAGEMFEDMSYKFHLKLTKTRFLLKDPEIFNGEVPQHALELERLNGKTLIRVKLSELSSNLKDGKYKLQFNTALELPATRILNSRDIPSLNFNVKEKIKL